MFSSSVFCHCFCFWKLRISLQSWFLLSDLRVTFYLPHPSRLVVPELWYYTDPGQTCWHHVPCKAFVAPQKPEEWRTADFNNSAFLQGASHFLCKGRWSFSSAKQLEQSNMSPTVTCLGTPEWCWPFVTHPGIMTEGKPRPMAATSLSRFWLQIQLLQWLGK